MFRHTFTALRTAGLAAALLALSASPAFAQHHGGGGGHGGSFHGGSFHGGSWHGGGYRGGYYGGYRGGYYGGYGRGWGYPGFYGRGWGVGIYTTPYVSGYSYPAYDYTYPADVYSYAAPDVTTYDVVPSVQTSSFYPPDTTSAPAATDTAGSATVRVQVPADAEVWFDGAATRQRGEDRVYSTPPLEAGRDYHYDIRARWMENGRPVEETRRVGVRAGQETNVDFMQPAGER